MPRNIEIKLNKIIRKIKDNKTIAEATLSMGNLQQDGSFNRMKFKEIILVENGIIEDAIIIDSLKDFCKRNYKHLRLIN